MKNRFRIISNILLILILSLQILPNHKLVKAEKTRNDTSAICYSLDVVFLIDQSGSMSDGSLASDPTNQRKFAVHSAIDYLADVALDKCKDSIHRIAVVSFGSTAQVDLEFGEIGPETIEEAIAIRNWLKAKIDVYDLGNTQPHEAFKKAKEIFDNNLTASTISEEAGLRKRVIIFITDGLPFPTNNGWGRYIEDLNKMYISPMFPFDPTLLKQEQCMNELQDRFIEITKAPEEDRNKCLSQYPAGAKEYSQSTYIYGLFLRSTDTYTSQFIDAWNEIFESHAGTSILLSQNRQDIPSTIRNLISRLTAIEVSVVNCGSFAVNPYVKRAILTFFKLDEDLQVTLGYQDAQGVTHSITGGVQESNTGFDLEEHKFDGANERYVINNPYPGIWNLAADNCDGLDAYYDPVQVKPGTYKPNLPAEIPQYEVPPYFDEYRPFHLEYQITDIDGRIVPQAEDPTFKVLINAKVTQPDGSVESYPMEYQTSDQLFRTTSPIKIPIAGVYSIDLSGAYLSHPGSVTVSSTNYSQVFTEQKILFEERGIEFKVHPVSTFDMAITSPLPSDDLGTVHGTILQGWPLPISSVNVSVLFTGPEGDNVMLSDILEDPNGPLEAMIESNGKSSATVKLSPDPENPNLYLGSIPDYDVEGAQNLNVRLSSKFNEYYRPLHYELNSTITREDGLFNRASTYRIILIILGLLLALRILLWTLNKKNKLSGYLLIKMNGTVVRVLNLISGNTSTIFSPGFLSGGAQTCIKSLKVFGAKNPPVAMRGDDENGLNAEVPPGKVKVKGSKSCSGKRFSVELISGYDTPVCEEDGCTIMYLDMNQATSFSDDIASADHAPARINIFSILSVVIHVGLIAWLLIMMLF